MAEMTATEYEAFLAEPRIAKLATLRPDGWPTIVPVWFEWADGRARVFTSVGTGKLRRIEADQRVSLSVEEPVGVAEAWVNIEGSAEVKEQGGIELATRLADRYYEPEQAKQAVAKWSQFADNLRVIEITPRRIISSAPETE